MNREKATGLAIRMQGGDMTAFDDMFSELYNKIYYIALKNLRNDEDAADVVQNTFIRAYLGIGNLKDPKMLIAWINMIALNECRRIVSQRKGVVMDEYNEQIAEAVGASDESSEPEPILDSKERKRQLMAAIDRLPENQKTAVMLYYFGELKVREVAYAMQCSEGMVKKHLFNARKTLKQSAEATEYAAGRRIAV